MSKMLLCPLESHLVFVQSHMSDLSWISRGKISQHVHKCEIGGQVVSDYYTTVYLEDVFEREYTNIPFCIHCLLLPGLQS